MSSYREMTLKLKATSDSTVGMTIEYIRDYPEINELFVLEILKYHVLPYKLDPSLPMSREIARSCAAKLEACARAIREKWNFPASQQLSISNDGINNLVKNVTPLFENQTIATQVSSSNSNDDAIAVTEIEKAALEKRQKRLGF